MLSVTLVNFTATSQSALHLGQTATKPDKVNICLCDVNERLIMMWL